MATASELEACISRRLMVGHLSLAMAGPPSIAMAMAAMAGGKGGREPLTSPMRGG